MSDKSELMLAFEQIEKDKRIKKEEILQVIENALVSAYKKHVGKNVNVEAKVDPETGNMSRIRDQRKSLRTLKTLFLK